MKVGDKVRCIWTQRRSKAYASYGACAVDGDTGIITAIHEKKDVTLVRFQTERGIVHCHIQNVLAS